MLFVPTNSLLHYLDHVNHATMILNPDLGSKAPSIKKGLKRIEKHLAEFRALEILEDVHLDL